MEKPNPAPSHLKLGRFGADQIEDLGSIRFFCHLPRQKQGFKNPKPSSPEPFSTLHSLRLAAGRAMSKCLRFKAPIPSFISGGKRWFSVITSNSPCASGDEDPMRESYAGVINGNISTERTSMSFETLFASLKKSSSTGYGAMQNMKTSPPSSVRNDDDFAELGPLLSSQSKSNDLLPQQKHESVEANKRAVTAQCSTPAKYSLDAPEYFKISISNISMETTEPSIYSMCIPCGYVAGLSRTKEDAAEVTFKVKDKVAAEGIVKRLSNISADGCKWSAKLLPDHDQNSPNNAAPMLIESKIPDVLRSFRKQFNMQRIYCEDLEDLHHAILHLRHQTDAT
ncbi:Nucleotide-binding alpha-beta plait domain-containing protein [Dioscorea alata]|uniref:Nucleotide-binding alpha-beta plait domain-containing protein n=1 Tax=Dioscorea alata TaxID=55571 RepID=A0ACB7VV99_DIOAL|nr:Nucleotide-binding alpha-beta plait domain-containing protein [Dioscorea alata]